VKHGTNVKTFTKSEINNVIYSNTDYVAVKKKVKFWTITIVIIGVAAVTKIFNEFHTQSHCTAIE